MQDPVFEKYLTTLGRHISGWRKVWGLTGQQVADRARISRQTLSQIENGRGGSVRLESVISVLIVLDAHQLLLNSLDPLEQEIGRIRADRLTSKRVRPRKMDDRFPPVPNEGMLASDGHPY